jgi:hypothetical protein
MFTVTVPRAGVTPEQVSEILQDKLGSRYSVKPATRAKGFGKEVADDANTMLVKGNAFEKANVTVVPGTDSTEIQVSAGATHPQVLRLLDRVDIARKVHQILENAPEFA